MKLSTDLISSLTIVFGKSTLNREVIMCDDSSSLMFLVSFSNFSSVLPWSQVKTYWLNSDGADVVYHMIDNFLL